MSKLSQTAAKSRSKKPKILNWIQHSSIILGHVSNSKISGYHQGEYQFSLVHFKNRDDGSIWVLRYLLFFGPKKAPGSRSSHWGSRHRPYIGFLMFMFRQHVRVFPLYLKISASILGGVISLCEWLGYCSACNDACRFGTTLSSGGQALPLW